MGAHGFAMLGTCLNSEISAHLGLLAAAREDDQVAPVRLEAVDVLLQKFRF